MANNKSVFLTLTLTGTNVHGYQAATLFTDDVPRTACLISRLANDTTYLRLQARTNRRHCTAVNLPTMKLVQNDDGKTDDFVTGIHADAGHGAGLIHRLNPDIWYLILRNVCASFNQPR